MNQLLLILSVIVLSGCQSIYPISNNNILESPAEFSFQTLSNPNLSKSEVLDKVKDNLNSEHLISDPSAIKVMNQLAPIEYDRLITEKPDDMTVIGNQIIKIMNGRGLGESIYVRGTGLNLSGGNKGANTSGFNMRNCTQEPNISGGRFNLQIKCKSDEFLYSILHTEAPSHRADCLFTVNSTGTITTANRISNGTINTTSYQFSCRSHGPGSIDFGMLLIDDRSFAYQMHELSQIAKHDETDLVADITDAVKSKLRKRYIVTEAGNQPKVEKKYNIDFATAKARLQRALGNFKYDDKKSAFSFEESYSKNDLTVLHHYTISLFPDKSETVIEYSGDYSYLSDQIGTSDLFGKDVYGKNMKNYNLIVNRLLK